MGVEWTAVLCTDDGSNKGNKMEKKEENKYRTRKVWGHLHAHITCPPSPGDISDPENKYLAGCQRLKDGF